MSRSKKYISVKTLVSAITGLFSFVVLFLFGVEYAFVWGVLVFAMNYIPYIGSILAVIFPVVLALLQFANWGIFLALLVLLMLVQTVVGYFVEPMMMGNELNISAFIVLVSLSVFSAIWGIIGMVISVPLVVSLIIILSHFDSTRSIAIMLSGDGVVFGSDHNLVQ